LLPTAIAFAKKATVTRQILLGEGCDEYGRIMPLLGTVAEGTKAFHDGADIFPKFGTTEIWEFWNTTVDAHPIHMHLVKFRVLNRQIMTATPVAKAMANGWTGVALASPPTLVDSTTGALIPPATSPVDAPPTEQGWKDTVVCPPGQVTRVVATFDKRGTYVYHCHILGHEEHDMMRWFQVI
jgi:spore coat protein A